MTRIVASERLRRQQLATAEAAAAESAARAHLDEGNQQIAAHNAAPPPDAGDVAAMVEYEVSHQQRGAALARVVDRLLAVYVGAQQRHAAERDRLRQAESDVTSIRAQLAAAESEIAAWAPARAHLDAAVVALAAALKAAPPVVAETLRPLAQGAAAAQSRAQATIERAAQLRAELV